MQKFTTVAFISTRRPYRVWTGPGHPRLWHRRALRRQAARRQLRRQIAALERQRKRREHLLLTLFGARKISELRSEIDAADPAMKGTIKALVQVLDSPLREVMSRLLGLGRPRQSATEVAIALESTPWEVYRIVPRALDLMIARLSPINRGG